MIGEAIAGAFGTGIVNNILGGGSGPSGMSTEDKQFQLDMVRLGNQEDLRNQKLAYDHRITRMKEYGLTPVEMFGSPASGAGGGTSGTGQTLGNMASQQAMQKQELRQQARLQQNQLTQTLGTELLKTKMQTDAQKDVAATQAGVTTRGQDINQAIAQQTLKLDREKLELEVTKATAQIGLTKAQTQKTLNEVATSDKKFVTAMKQLSMGPANLLVELTMRDYGISLSDDSFNKLSSDQRQAILTKLTALASTVYVEGQGSAALGQQTSEKGLETVQIIMQTLEDVIKGTARAVTGNLGIQPAVPVMGNRPGSPVPAGTPLYKNFNQDFPGRN